MTVTQRRVRADPGSDERTATEPGIKYTCDCCGIDVTHTVRIKCAAKECEEVDLCPSCFCEGEEVQRHKAWHDYKVVEQHSQPVFTPDWGADEELLLISGLILNGLGNWAEAASHVGTRTKEECEKHYLEVYLGMGRAAKREFMPDMDQSFHFDPDEMQARKKARIEELRKPHALPSINALVSAPTNHEVAGYMPGRLEFEHEVDNDAEMVVKDFEFGMVWKYGGDEQPQVTKVDEDVKPELPDVEEEDELEVKLALLDIYFSKLDKREEAKDLIFDRGLTEHKRIQAMERKRPKEERELVQRYKVFAKLQTAQDLEVLLEGLIYEQNLRKRIAELQEYRRMGVTTGPEADAYEQAKAARSGYRPRDVLPTGARINAGQHRFLHGTPPPSKEVVRVQARKPPTPLNLANAASLDLLSNEEKSLCSALRVMPKPYLTIKEMYIRENERRKGLLKRRDARKMMKIDVNKSGRIFDFLVSAGMLILAYDPTAKPAFPVGKENGFFGVSLQMVNGGQQGAVDVYPGVS